MDIVNLPGSEQKAATETQSSRRWTNEELHKLFKDYFDRQPGICPVCASQVSMMMDHEKGMAMLTLRCRGCGNSSTVFS
jgi:transcription elongation factor Elf1